MIDFPSEILDMLAASSANAPIFPRLVHSRPSTRSDRLNKEKLAAAQAYFLDCYPGGFAHPDMQAIAKKHKVDQRTAFAQKELKKPCFDEPEAVVQAIAKLVSGSSMVSMFEKPKFKAAVERSSPKERKGIAAAYYELLHGDEAAGFEQVAAFLQKHRVAKWPVATAVPCYFRPNKDVLIKPTTVKLIIAELELPIKYGPKLDWAFYAQYRKYLAQARKQCDPALAPNNAAFAGFLMMSLGTRSAPS